MRRLLNFIFVCYENESPKKGVIVSKLVFLFQHRYSTLMKASEFPVAVGRDGLGIRRVRVRPHDL